MKAENLSFGWGFHMWIEFDDSGETVWHKYSAAGANALAATNALVDNPVFDRGFAPMMTSPISYEMIAEALGHHIPAVSSAVGKTPVLLVQNRNVDLNSEDYKSTDWPRRNDAKEDRRGWLHSDIKNVSYRFTYEFFRDLIYKGGLKCER